MMDEITIDELDLFDARARNHLDKRQVDPNVLAENIIVLIRQCKYLFARNEVLNNNLIELNIQCEVYKDTIRKYYQMDQNLDAIYGDMYQEEVGLSG